MKQQSAIKVYPTTEVYCKRLLQRRTSRH